LLILGERDMMTPTRSAAAVAEAIPNADTVVLPRAGHALLSERPDPVLDALVRVV
jgi:pimeloyl-ACP methyl ester carboxylesterase